MQKFASVGVCSTRKTRRCLTTSGADYLEVCPGCGYQHCYKCIEACMLEGAESRMAEADKRRVPPLQEHYDADRAW